MCRPLKGTARLPVISISLVHEGGLGKDRGEWMKGIRKISKSDLIMASAAFAWGFSYIFMKLGLESIAPLQLGFMRFAIAFPVLLLIFRKKVVPNATELRYSMLLGLFVFALTAFYHCGLKTTEASAAGFLAGTTVAMVPLINGLLLRKIPEKKTLLCVMFAFGGIAVMSFTQDFSIAGGAWLCLGGAVSYAVQIVFTDRALIHCRALTIAVWQLGFAALYSGIFSFLFETTSYALPLFGWGAVLGLALLSSAYGYVAQTMAQKKVAPERIGFLYALEPVFCAILAVLFFHEIMSLRELTGAVMIVVSILLG